MLVMESGHHSTRNEVLMDEEELWLRLKLLLKELLEPAVRNVSDD